MGTRRPLIALALFAMAMAGCEVSSPVVPAGHGSYIVSSHVGACISCSATVQSAKTASAFCAAKHQGLEILTSRDETNQFGYVVANEMTFACQ